MASIIPLCVSSVCTDQRLLEVTFSNEAVYRISKIYENGLWEVELLDENGVTLSKRGMASNDCPLTLAEREFLYSWVPKEYEFLLNDRTKETCLVLNAYFERYEDEIDRDLIQTDI